MRIELRLIAGIFAALWQTAGNAGVAVVNPVVESIHWLIVGDRSVSLRQITTPLKLAEGWWPISVADWDRDGEIELLARNRQLGRHALIELVGLSSGQHRQVGGPGEDWELVGEGDFDGDGHIDLLARHTGTSGVRAWVDIAEGHRTLALGRLGLADEAVQAVGDFDGDGVSDLVVQRAGANGIRVLHSRDGRLHSSSRRLVASAASEYQILTAAAIGPGDADWLMVRHKDSGRLLAWSIGEHGEIAETHVIGRPPSWYQIVHLADWDSDGDMDLLWRNTRRNVYGVYEMDDGRITAVHGALADSTPPIGIPVSEYFPTPQLKPSLFDQVPRWVSRTRTHGHTRLGPVHPRLGAERGFLDTVESDRAALGFRDLGTRVFTRHVKARFEDPWWPSGVPSTANFDHSRINDGVVISDGRDVVAEYVSDAESSGSEMIAYYWLASDSRTASENPRWLCRDQSGNVASHAHRGQHLDLTSPYRDVILFRLLELAERGVGAFYFDHSHLPTLGCYGTQVERAFEALAGHEVPSSSNSPHFRRWQDFNGKRLQEAFRYWRSAVRSAYPDIRFIISTNRLAGLTHANIPLSLARMDIPKTEWNTALRPFSVGNVFARNADIKVPPEDLRMAVGWLAIRPLRRPFHLWAHSLPNPDHARALVHTVSAFGGITALDVIEENILYPNDPDGATTRETLRSAFRLGKRLGGILDQQLPYAWAAVLLQEDVLTEQSDAAEQWRKINWPIMGMLDACVSVRVPTRLMTTSELEAGEFEDVGLILIPNPDSLSRLQLNALSEFAKAGGHIVENKPEWHWSSEGLSGAASEALREQIHQFSSKSPIRLDGDISEPVWLHSFVEPVENASSATVVLLNDFSWVSANAPLSPDIIPAEPAPAVVTGGQVSIDVDHFGLPSEVRTYDALTGEPLAHYWNSNRLRVEVPEFQQAVWIRIEGR